MYFEAVIKRNDENKGKEVTERFIVKGVELFAEAEATMLAEFSNESNAVVVQHSHI